MTSTKTYDWQLTDRLEFSAPQVRWQWGVTSALRLEEPRRRDAVAALAAYAGRGSVPSQPSEVHPQPYDDEGEPCLHPETILLHRSHLMSKHQLWSIDDIDRSSYFAGLA